MQYRVVKNGIFKSIQGEGHNVGRNAIFIRLAGCNMMPRCSFCDEHFDEYIIMTEEEIYKKVKRLSPSNFIVITGGEPTIQKLNKLVKRLQKNGYTVALETNGVLKPDCEFDWVTCSPKTDNLEQQQVDELKFVVDKDKDKMLQYIESIKENVSSRYVYLQPKSNEIQNIQTALELISDNPEYRLSMQLHKIIGIL